MEILKFRLFHTKIWSLSNLCSELFPSVRAGDIINSILRISMKFVILFLFCCYKIEITGDTYFILVHPMNQKRRNSPMLCTKWRRHPEREPPNDDDNNGFRHTLYTTKTYTSECGSACSYLNKIKIKKCTHRNQDVFLPLLFSLLFGVALHGYGIAWHGMASCRISIHSQSQYRCFLWVECNDYLYLFLHLF